MPTAAKTLARDDPRAAFPLYTILEASRYLGLPYSTLRTWVRPEAGPPLVHSLDKEGHAATIAFVGFAEAFVLAAARRAGVRPGRIRDGVEAVKSSLGLEHALATQRLYVDGAEILVRHAYDADPGDLTVARTSQIQMTETVKNQLQLIRYGGDGFADQIVLPIFGHARVLVDPDEAFGQPIVERTGTRVRDVLGLFWADESIENIAYDYNLTTEEVQDVIRAQTKPPA